MRRLAGIVAVVMIGALLVGGAGPVITGNSGPRVTGAIGTGMADRCQRGTEVSAFVCRNTWMAWTRRAVR
jgi:hypothetical protein